MATKLTLNGYRIALTNDIDPPHTFTSPHAAKECAEALERIAFAVPLLQLRRKIVTVDAEGEDYNFHIWRRGVRGGPVQLWGKLQPTPDGSTVVSFHHESTDVTRTIAGALGGGVLLAAVFILGDNSVIGSILVALAASLAVLVSHYFAVRNLQERVMQRVRTVLESRDFDASAEPESEV